jgi:hypothetical protein
LNYSFTRYTDLTNTDSWPIDAEDATQVILQAFDSGFRIATTIAELDDGGNYMLVEPAGAGDTRLRIDGGTRVLYCRADTADAIVEALVVRC